MTRFTFARCWPVLAGFLLLPLLVSWGTFGHEHINRAAVMALPDSMQGFFFNHVDFITQESTVPDLRKYTLNDKAENPRHYIDIENFEAKPEQFTVLADVQKKYDAAFLQQNGILPWYMTEIMDKLTRAFREQRKTEILFLSADLAHYIGDCCRDDGNTMLASSGSLSNFFNTRTRLPAVTSA